jgi:hypothetical protein
MKCWNSAFNAQGSRLIKLGSCRGRSSENICKGIGGGQGKMKDRMKLSLPPKLVEILVWVPGISLCKILISSYTFNTLLCRNWPLPNRETLQITLLWSDICFLQKAGHFRKRNKRAIHFLKLSPLFFFFFLWYLVHTKKRKRNFCMCFMLANTLRAGWFLKQAPSRACFGNAPVQGHYHSLNGPIGSRSVPWWYTVSTPKFQVG